MSSVKLHSAEVVGIDGEIIDVEIDLAPGLFSFSIVGLADKAVDESRHRIAAAIKNSGARQPQKKNNRVTVSLAPADLKKEGPAFDLPIALAYMLVSGQAKFNPAGKIFIGELSLDGSLRPVRGTLSLALAAKEAGFSEIYVPCGNGTEAAIAEGIAVYEMPTLLSTVHHLENKELQKRVPSPALDTLHTQSDILNDFTHVRGQESAKRALEIAAAGAHNIVLSGPPGSGKTLLSRALPSILPPPSREEIIEITKIHSVAGSLHAKNGVVAERPFRSPHHTASHIAIVGGGTFPRPGEITLAHRGVLFMDEFSEFDKRVLEALRQPLEDRVISVSRAKGSITYPANILLVGAMNPCPCGNLGNPTKECVCPPHHIERYARKISGPIADRIDLWVDVDPVEHEKLSAPSGAAEPSLAVRERVVAARTMQRQRFLGTKLSANSEIGARDIDMYCPLNPATRNTLNTAARVYNLSARVYHRAIKIARTIADLEGSEHIAERHILEAVQYRPKVRN
ncbi:MAG: magnesium chelatase family protein [Parcubacteria group bacterium Gr01-1014_29]|nr:MAG: magnesium chelatase family protein [Parcubacteria group bacterium Gr01-1014_29]